MIPKRISFDIFFNFLYRLLIFIAVFDGIRSRMSVFADVISVFKEISTFTLLIFILARVGVVIDRKNLIYSNLPLLIYLIVAATLIISINDIDRSTIPALNRPGLPTSYAIHFKTIESFVLLFVLLNYQLMTKQHIESLMTFFVRVAVGYVIFTVIVYFLIDLSFLFQTPWYGRISIGYPTSDTQILCFALAYLLFTKAALKSFQKIIFMIILVTGVLMNATATGIITLVILFTAYGIFSIFNGNMIRLFSPKNLIVALIIFASVFTLEKITTAFSAKLSTFYSLFDTKYSIASGKLLELVGSDEQESEDNEDVDFSEMVRTFQIEKAFFYANDNASMLLGGPISIGTTIENENYFMLRSYGYVGLILYYGWLASLALLALFNISNSYGQLLMLSIAILFITNFAIITTYLFGIAAPFALLISYCLNNINKARESSYFPKAASFVAA